MMYKIESIELYKFERLFLNNITKIKLKPESTLQLILGSNGSGKSSLSGEINPLPYDKSMYGEDGYKEIIISYKKRKFVISSGKLGVNKHSFKIDNIEFNTGYTKKVQLQLVKEYFNLTPKRNDVLLDKIKLTTMSLGERKHWLREIATVDYVYSIGLYDFLNKKHRTVLGGIALLNEEIANDIKLSLEDEEVKRLEATIELYSDTIENLMFSYDNNVNNLEFKKNEEELEETVKNLEKCLARLTENKTKEELESILLEESLKAKRLTSEIDAICKDIEKIEFMTAEEIDLSFFTNRKKELEKEIDYLTKMNPIKDFDINNLPKLRDDFKNVHNKLLSYVEALKELDSTKHTDEEVKALHSSVMESKYSLGNLHKIKENTLQELKTLKDSLNADNKIICKKCGDVSYFGYDVERVNSLENRLVDLDKKIDIKTEKYSKDEETFISVKRKLEIIKAIKDITRDTGYLYNYILREEPCMVNSVVVYSRIDHLYVTLEEVYSLPRLKEELDSIKEKIKIQEAIGSNKRKELVIQRKALEEKLTVKTKEKKETNNRITKSKEELVNVKNKEVLTERLLGILKDNKQNKKIAVKLAINSTIKKTVGELKTELEDIKERLNSNLKVSSRIDNNRKLLEKYKIKEKVLSKSLEALSPTEGLIAKSINSFLNKLVSDMNYIISKVWSYPLEILPCSIEGSDLSYKFRVMVKDENRKPIPDVSNLSSSMKDIVDLAFKITFMKYGKLQHLPLILDEFGVTMDDKHRYTAYQMIESILTDNFNQIFLIAHFKSLYGRFLESDVTILDSNNLELESSVFNSNPNVEINN